MISSGPSLASSTLSGVQSVHDAATVSGRPGRTRSFAAAMFFILLHAGLAHAATTYYVDNKAGSDTNNGLTAATAFKTIAKVNTITPLLQPGDQVLLRAGERFTDDFIHCDNLVKATSTTTLTSNPAVCSGTSGAPIVFGKYASGSDPIIDAADPLAGLVWRALGNGVYSTQLAVAPQKLYIDKLTEAPQLIPVPNFVGNYDSRGATTYEPWDSVLDPSTGLYQMNGGNTPQTATIGVLGLGGVWESPYATSAAAGGQTSQVFSPTNTGLQNVEVIGGGSVSFSLYGGTGYPASFTFSSIGGGSIGGVACEVDGTVTSISGVPASVTYNVNRGCSSIPTLTAIAATGRGLKFFGRVDSGSFYYASTSQNGALANELYVHLADGSDPSHHTFYATHRSYGILLRGVNYVSVTHIQFAHQLKSGVMSFPYSSSTTPGMYWTNENITISHATCWNTGDTVSDTLAWGYNTSRTANLEACVVLRASGDTDPHLVRGNSISDSWSGMIDTYYGRGDTSHANFILSGIDGTRTIGGVTSNYPVIQYSYGRSHNAACIRYGQAGLMRDALYLNKGGIVSNNECTDNAVGNIFFGATAGGQASHNFIHDSLGEGIQAGGNSTSVPDASSYEAQVFDHNVIANLGFSATLSLYNGIDINNGLEGSNYPYISDVHVFNNTIVNTASACVTLEMNVVAAHVHENVCAQSANYFPAGWICPNCITTTNNAAGIFVRVASMQYAKPMDWHNNVWQNQGGPVNSWVIYNVQNTFSQRGTCSNITTFLNKNNASAQLEPTSFCTATPGFENASGNDFRLLSSSPLRAAGTGGSDVGALAFGASMFPVGPR
ncbi:hypothetical protein [Granulicella sibirica]|uniref:hypothetical protein n=1 Tax=Granulicella sibirica TaxID=2479048 RepID=UPI001008E8EA|nr:hypothetical protein [Granulicella sibirica]